MSKRTWMALSLVLAQWAVGGTIPYQGTVAVKGTPFTGTGYFKFQIRNGADQVVWSNDGSTGGGPPAGYVTVPVNGGLFHVTLGDPALGMAPIPGHVWHEPPIRLRAWFSTNTVDFEQLSPDVTLDSLDLSLLDTGNLLIVDDDPGSDFSSLESALAHMATNHRYSALLIMPGSYQLAQPLVMPSNRWLVIRGFDPGTVEIVHSNGPALVLGQGELRGVTIRGNPAVTDLGALSPVNVRIADAHLQRRSGEGPALELGSTSTWVECRHTFFSAAAGLAAHVAQGARFTAVDSIFNAWEGHGPAIGLSTGAVCELRRIKVWTQSGRAIWAQGPLGDRILVDDAELQGGVCVTQATGNITFRSADIQTDSAHGAAIELFVSGPGTIRVECVACSVQAFGAPVALMAAHGGARAALDVKDSQLRSIGLTNGPAAVVITNSHEDAELVQLSLANSELEVDGSASDQWAIVVGGANVKIVGSYVQGSGGGISGLAGAEVELMHSAVWGGSTSVQLANGQLSAQASEIGADDGVALKIAGGVRATVIQSWLEGDGPQGIGVLSRALDDATPALILVGTGTMGGSRALDFAGGLLMAARSTFVTETGLVARIVGEAVSPDVSLMHCEWLRLMPGDLPAILLGTSPSRPPILSHCAIHAEGATYSIAPEGGVPSVNVRMVNSTLNTGVAPGVNVQPATHVGNGNYIP